MTSQINIDWDTILENVETDKTILCIGADLFSNINGKLDVHLREIIGASPDVRIYEDGLFNFKNRSDMTSYIKIKKFYNQELPDVAAVLDKLAQIRFSTIISLNPDAQLTKAFDHQGYTYNYVYHYPNTPAKELPQPSPNKPLIYNLLGDINYRESMVLTHEDLFEFLESVVQGKSISATLKEQIKAAYNFVFIGLPFEKWHTQLLLRFLQKDINRMALKFAANHAQDENIEMFCQDEFNITCVPTNVADFVNELYERCKSAQLLKGKPKTVNQFEVWSKQVRKDELAEVVEEVIDYFDNKPSADIENINYITNVSARLSSLEKKVDKGAISNDNATVERAQIRDTIIQFLTNVVKADFLS
jgi:hypothetical protein